MDASSSTVPRYLHCGNTRFEQTVLLLQGGGALGSYQAGVYQALAEANLHPNWVAGISIGAINSALIAGNPREKRVERLREFWEAVSTSPLGLPYFPSLTIPDDSTHSLLNQTRALGILLFGAPNFFAPRLPPPMPWEVSGADAVSFYDVSPLKATLERLVDFDRINAGGTRLSVGAVNVRTGNFVYFDTTTHRIAPAHIIASGSLPPGFPATEIDGEYYWDGGIVSNTPLQWVLDSRPRRDTLAFQIDLWSAEGELPHNLADADLRAKDIRFSSRTRASTDLYKYTQKLRIAFATLLKRLPDELRGLPEVALLASEANEKVCNIVQLIYRAKKYEGSAKDYEFSRRTMEEHWLAGYRNTVHSLSHREIFEPPDRLEGVRTFDFLITAQRREMIMSKTMSRVVPGLALAAAIVASTGAILSKAEAAGDAAAGEHVFARCLVCHSPKAGENKIGPSLAGVFGRKSGSAPGYDYSPAMKSAGITWDEQELDKYLTNPPADVHGTKMVISVPSAEDRQNVIAYLKTLK